MTIMQSFNVKAAQFEDAPVTYQALRKNDLMVVPRQKLDGTWVNCCGEPIPEPGEITGCFGDTVPLPPKWWHLRRRFHLWRLKRRIDRGFERLKKDGIQWPQVKTPLPPLDMKELIETQPMDTETKIPFIFERDDHKSSGPIIEPFQRREDDGSRPSDSSASP